MHVVEECLVVPIQVELRDDVVLRIQRDILRRVHETGARGVVIDVSGMDIIDSFIAETLAATARMASLLGAETILVGLRPEVVAALVHLDCDFGDMRTARTLQRALDMLSPELQPDQEPQEVEEVEEDRIQDEDADAEEDED